LSNGQQCALIPNSYTNKASTNVENSMMVDMQNPRSFSNQNDNDSIELIDIFESDSEKSDITLFSSSQESQIEYTTLPLTPSDGFVEFPAVWCYSPSFFLSKTQAPPLPLPLPPPLPPPITTTTNPKNSKTDTKLSSSVNCSSKKRKNADRTSVIESNQHCCLHSKKHFNKKRTKLTSETNVHIREEEPKRTVKHVTPKLNAIFSCTKKQKRIKHNRP
jgi:hypothetical protein